MSNISYLFASSCVSNVTVTGDWNQPSSWLCDASLTSPGCSDTIIIDTNDLILITSTVDLTSCGPVYIFVHGTLQFQIGKKLKLAEGSILELSLGAQMVPGGGGGNSNYLEIGDDKLWTAEDGIVLGPISYGISTLPVLLSSFNVMCDEDNFNRINWSTVSEINNSYFIIEKSFDGINFYEFSKIIGEGNSNVTINYQFIDETKSNDGFYYKLKQVDVNGEVNYLTDIIYVKCNKENELRVNIKNRNLFIWVVAEKEEVYIVKVFDYTGKLILAENVKIRQGENNFRYPLLAVMNNIYFVQIQLKNSIKSYKIISTG